MNLPADLLARLQDKGLARLGDAYLNLVYSLAITRSSGKPTGLKVSDRILADAARISGLRNRLPRRTPRGRLSDIVEALLAHLWLDGRIGFEDAVDLLAPSISEPSNAFAHLITEGLKRLGLGG